MFVEKNEQKLDKSSKAHFYYLQINYEKII
jgi:hypothetical protein